MKLGPPLLGYSLGVCGHPDSMLMYLSFFIKTSYPCALCAKTNSEVQETAVSNSRDPKGEVKIAEALGYKIWQ